MQNMRGIWSNEMEYFWLCFYRKSEIERNWRHVNHWLCGEVTADSPIHNRLQSTAEDFKY